MDYYGGGYNDYRAAGGTSAYHPSYGPQHPNVGRYGPAHPIYRNGMPRSGATHDGFDRYGYQNVAHSGYSPSQYGYNYAPEMKPSNYYSNHHLYDSPSSYRNGMVNGHGAATAASAAAAYSSYRDPYASDAAMYRSKGNYMMRDTPYQYPGNREYNYYGYGAQQAMSPNGANDSTIPPPMQHHHNVYGPEYSPPDASNFPVSPGHNIATDFPYNVSREYKQARKSQRDKSLSKLVAMNRRLETQVTMMNEAESMDRPLHGYYDASGYVDSINSYGENYYHGMEYNGSNGNWQSPAETTASATVTKGSQLKATKSNDNDDETEIPSPSKNRNNNKNDNPMSEKKNNSAESDSVPIKRRRKQKHSNASPSIGSREDMQNLMPLPGFQQAFGSTEIGRFSELFFNAPESPIEPLSIFETELDALSPQPWETGDSLEGPHYNQTNGPFTPVYAESYGSTDSPTASSSSYFSDIRSNDF